MSSVLLSFTPPVACWHCGEPSTLGLYNEDWQELRASCPVHGYLETGPEDMDTEYASVERFVVSLYGGLGRARILERLADVVVDGIPNYYWLCEYTGDGGPERLKIVWSNAWDGLFFERCEATAPVI